MPLTRKRFRSTTTRHADNVSRRTLAARVTQVPRFWRHVASAAGVTSIDDLFCRVGRAIYDAADAVPKNAEAARCRLRELRLVIHDAVDARFDELESKISAAEAVKAAALACELIAVDAALQRWRSDTAAVSHTIAVLSDAELETQQAALTSRLTDIEAQLQELPTAILEPPTVDVVADTPAMLSAIAAFGHVLAPRPVTAADLSFDGLPACSSVRPGDTLHLRVSLGTHHAAQSTDELAEALDRLEREIDIEAAVESSGVEPQPLTVTLSHDAALRSLLICLRVPAAASSGDCIVLSSVSVAGQPVTMSPLRLLINQGMRAPLQLAGLAFECCSPSISGDGLLFVPPVGRGTEVHVYDTEGSRLPGLPLAAIGLSHLTRWTACAHGDPHSLFLVDDSRAVAFDTSARAVRWSSDIAACGGIATLPAHGIAALASCEQSKLFFHRLSDGCRVGSVAVPKSSLRWFIAADAESGAVFGTCRSESGFAVHAWSCLSGGSRRLKSEGPVLAAGVEKFPRPVTVVPPAPGKKKSHLVVSATLSSELRVLSLPDRVLVHTHKLDGIQVNGLAADPWGGVLAVCDKASNALHVLAWPLPGMPPLA